MSSLKLSEQIRCAKVVAATHQKYVDAFARHYERQLYLERRDEQRQNPNTDYVFHNSIDRLFTAEAWAYAEAIGLHKGTSFEECVKQRKDFTTRNIEKTKTARQPSLRPVAEWYRERRQDIMHNFLIDEWKAQRNKPNAIHNFALYAVYMAAKAVVSVLTDCVDGENILARFSNSIPDRRLLLTIKQQPDYEPNNIEWYFQEIVTLPAMLGAIDDVLTRYGDVVRAIASLGGTQPDTTELPDNPIWYLPEKLSEYELLEQAAMEYLSGEFKSDQIARDYGLGQKRFRNYLRERGLMKGHGGDRNG